MLTSAITPAQADQVDSGLFEACGASPNWFCEEIYKATDNETLAKLIDWLVGRPLSIALVLVAASITSWLSRRYFSRVVREVVARRGEYTAQQLRRLGLDTTDTAADAIRREARTTSITAVITSTLTVVIWSTAIMFIIEILGLNLGPFLATAGIVGVALGFGAQSIVKDCLTGLFMLLEDQYGIGDSVDLGEPTGTVEEISLRTTVVRGFDGTVWHVPNGQIFRVGNRSQLWSMAVIDVTVAYDTDLDEAGNVIFDTASAVCEDELWTDRVLEPPTLLGVEQLGPEMVTLRLVVKTAPGSQWALQRVLRERLKVALQSAGIHVSLTRA